MTGYKQAVFAAPPAPDLPLAAWELCLDLTPELHVLPVLMRIGYLIPWYKLASISCSWGADLTNSSGSVPNMLLLPLFLA